jgi:hypothetical protein
MFASASDALPRGLYQHKDPRVSFSPPKELLLLIHSNYFKFGPQRHRLGFGLG